MNALERFIVIDIGQVQRRLAKGHIAGNALRRDRQLEVAAAAQAGLDLGNNRRTVLGDRIQREPVGVEQLADVLAGFQHDLLHVFGVVDARGDLVQLAVKQRLEGHTPGFRGQLLRLEKRLLRRLLQAWGCRDGTHTVNS